MPIAVLLLGVIVQALGQASVDTQDVERRSVTLDSGQIALDRMMREFRQATWVYFRSSSVVDLNVRVRATPTSAGTYRLVRWDCSGETCVRSEGSPTSYPPPSVPSFATSAPMIGDPSSDLTSRNGQVIGHDIFQPQRLDPATGTRVADYLSPDYVAVRLRLGDRGHPDGSVELQDGVSLRNRTTYAG
jgi:hypothetical protein